MTCDICRAEVPQSELREHLGRNLCEDCYMDALSPSRTCDPWAQYNANSFAGKPQKLCRAQEQILEVLKSQGPISPEGLLNALAGEWSRELLEREYATLKRLEMVRAVNSETGILLKIW